LKWLDQLSQGWRTDLIFPRLDAQVVARPGYLLVRTPHNPTFWWGNFLLFDHAPVQGEGAQWLARFDAEIASRQCESRHLAFGVDSDLPFEMPAALLRAGLSRRSEAPMQLRSVGGSFSRLHCTDSQVLRSGATRHASTVLTMQPDQLRPRASGLPEGFRIAALELPAQASAAVELQVAADAGEHQPVSEYRVFRARQMQRYGAMQQAGLGRWFGVFARTDRGDELVAGCGLFSDGGGAWALGRFQFVSTHPAWCRRGLCSALVQTVCRHGFEVMTLHTLVIVAEPDEVAIGLYESVGFVRGASTWQLECRPDAARA
jgi:RimJ/RimL family protein N-acetyltransferase